jgi:hypothetical protein
LQNSPASSRADTFFAASAFLTPSIVHVVVMPRETLFTGFLNPS